MSTLKMTFYPVIDKNAFYYNQIFFSCKSTNHNINITNCIDFLKLKYKINDS